MADLTHTVLNTIYPVNATDDEIRLKITVGDVEQTSRMQVDIDEENIVKKHPGNFTEKTIGTNESLRGKELQILCTIADTSRDSDLLSVTIRLSGGIADLTYPLFATVDNQGDSIKFFAFIKFFRPKKHAS